MRKTFLRVEGMGILVVKTWRKVFHTEWAAHTKTLRWEHDSVFRRQQRGYLSLLNGRRASSSPTVGLLGSRETETLQTQWSGSILCFANREKIQEVRRQKERWENRHTLACFLLFFLVSSIWHLRKLPDLSTCRTSLLHVLIGAATVVILQGWREWFCMAAMYLLPSMP